MPKLLTMVSTLCLAATFADDHPCQPAPYPSQWAQAAYPDFCNIDFSVGSAFGISSYEIHDIPEFNRYLNGSFNAFTLGFTQRVAFYSWFYLEMREDFSLGFASYLTEDTIDEFSRLPRKPWFFDGDAKLYVPFFASAANRISVQPVIGFAVHQAYIRGSANWLDSKKSSLLRYRFFAPLFGLAIGYNPTHAFAVRSSVNVHLPLGKHSQPVHGSAVPAGRYTSLSQSRHGLSMDLLAMIKVSTSWTLTAELDYFAYKVHDTRVDTNPNQRWNQLMTTRMNAKIGAAYSF